MARDRGEEAICGPMLLGRGRESEVLDRLLVGARDGHGGALVVHGEAGIGKTALLEYAVGAAQGFQVLRALGNEAERELPFAALHQLCAPGLVGLEAVHALTGVMTDHNATTGVLVTTSWFSRTNEQCQTACSSWSGPLTLPVLFAEDPKFAGT